MKRITACLKTSLILYLGLVLQLLSVRSATNDHVILITIDGAAAYYLDDTNAPLPTVRHLANQGATAEGMRVSNPAVTWPNHTTLVTGVSPARHSVLFNGVLSRPGPGRQVTVDGARNQSELVAVPTLFDLLHEAGYRVADINWPCTRGATTLEDSFPDVPFQVDHMTPRLREELVNHGILPGTNQASFQGLSAARRDQIWTAAAAHVIRERRPNLMVFHMLICDSIQHKYGPQSAAAYTALAQADAQLAEVLRSLEAAGIRERTTIFVTADHGFDTALKIINPNVAFRKAGLLETATAPTLMNVRAQIISEGGIALVYFTDPAGLTSDRTRVIELMNAQEGIAETLTPDQFAALGMPDPAKNRQMADLILTAKPGYAFSNEPRGDDTVSQVSLATGNQGHHGFLSSNPKMNALFVASGRGIRRGAKLGLINNTDVAPTIAFLLAIDFPATEGRVLRELVEQ